MTVSVRPAEPETPRILRLRLYVAAASPNSIAARENVDNALKLIPERQVDLEIIDIVHDPDRGVRDGILVTPMLVRVEPLPTRQMLGRLQDRNALLNVLGLEVGESGVDGG